MIEKCPGQDKRNLSQESIICNACGYDVEIFSDEPKVRCPRCKNFVWRKMLPSCAEWCRSARDCIGQEKWKQLKGG